MAFFETHYFSEVLGIQVKMNVILPGHPGIEPKPPYKVLYLLHGMSQNADSWLHHSSIRTYAEDRGIAVIMPYASMSWYTDMKYGFAFETALVKELPAVVRRLFPCISDKREDTFVAGLSMGAYGAIKFGMLYPDRYSVVGAFSPPPDIAWHMKNPDFPDWEHRLYHDIFGTEEEYHQSDNDLYTVAAKHAEAAKNTKFYLWCGTEDVYLPQSRSIAKTLLENGYDVTYKESAGDHSWWYWNPASWEFMQLLPTKEGM